MASSLPVLWVRLLLVLNQWPVGIGKRQAYWSLCRARVCTPGLTVKLLRIIGLGRPFSKGETPFSRCEITLEVVLKS